MFGADEEVIDLVFGGATIVTAVIATLVGAWLVDRAGSSIKASMAFCGWSSVVRALSCMSFPTCNLQHAAWMPLALLHFAGTLSMSDQG